MAERRWGAIASGATFEALATTLVFFEDPGAILFGRDGKDGGQDARSGDGARVFQSKHHESAAAASAIRDAKKEAAKIKGYRQASHRRHEQWSGVTHWRLVTNAAFNPTDKHKWDEEVVPLFEELELVADYWERQNLDALLDRYPEIHRSFFENETRALLSVAEVQERLPEQEPFLRREELASFCGRTTELSEIRAFLASSRRFLVVHGQGGMGKTRLLVEAGENIANEGAWQVLWANVASMTASGAWFDGVVPERSTLLLVDEPPDEILLQQLSEQLGGRVGRTAHWKVAVAVRSQKDPVLRFLFSARMRPIVQELSIGPLLEADAEAMCASLLASGPLAHHQAEEWLRDASTLLTRRFSRHPVWLTLAIHLLEDRGDLNEVPATANDLVNEYLAEIEHSQTDLPPQTVRDLLRWVALLGTVNREDDATMSLIGEGSAVAGPNEVRKRLAALVTRRALVARGAHNRFVELKPDVVRDHVLRDWLSVDVQFGESPVVASDAAKRLLKSLGGPLLAGTLSAHGLSILVAIARTEFLLRLSDQNLSLLPEFLDAIRYATPSMTASQRIALAEVLGAIASFQPIPTAGVVSELRKSACPEERIGGLFGERVLGQTDVLLELAWPLFRGAMGSRTSEAQDVILRELCALAEAEATLAPSLKRGLPNDGKRAAALIERVIAGGPQFWSDFNSTAAALGHELLSTLARHAPQVGQTALLKALIKPALAVERQQTWSDEQSMHIQTFAIDTAHPGWKVRAALLTHIKLLISDDATPVASRLELWRVFADAHHNINQTYKRGGPQDQHYSAVLDDLLWARQVLERRSGSLEELSAARDLWNWHRQLERDPQLKAGAAALEALYIANDLAAEFEPLLGRDDWEQREPRAATKAAQLARTQDADELFAFVDRALAFLGADQAFHQIIAVAWSLGDLAAGNACVQDFAKTLLALSTVGPRSDFGAVTAASWVMSVRTGALPAHTADLVTDLLSTCGSDSQRANLLLRIYGRVPKLRGVGELSVDEYALLRARRRLFIDTGRAPEFVAAMAQTAEHDWPNLRSLLEGVLEEVPLRLRAATIKGLIEGSYWAVRPPADITRLPAEYATWLMDQLLLMPDLGDLDGNVEWKLQEIFQHVGRVGISWLPDALASRRDLEVMYRMHPDVRSVSFQTRFSRFIQPVTTTNVGADSATAMDALLEFLGDNGSIGHRMPELLRDLDPEGLIVPSAVVAKLANVTDAEQLWRLAQIGGTYILGTHSWRTIAKAALKVQSPHVKSDQTLFSALSVGAGRRHWGGRRGEVPPLFVWAVEEASAALQSEVDVDLRPFWQWRLSIAQAELLEQEQRAKEDRGE